MKTTITKCLFFLVISNLHISCNYGQQIKQSLEPIKVADNQYIYQYTLQKNLDTLNYGFSLNNSKRPYSFSLENPNSDYAQNTDITIWSAKKIKKFEEKIKKRPTFLDISLRESRKLETLFSEYCKQGKMKDRLATINDFSEKSDDLGNDVLVSSTNSYEHRAPFDYFMLYGSDSIKKETTKIILNRIPRVRSYYFENLVPLLVYEKSEAYYNAMYLLRTNIDTIQNKDTHLTNLKNYIAYIAPEMVRIGGKKIIEDVLNTVDYIYRNDKSWFVQQHFRDNVKTVFNTLFRFHKINKTTQKYINDRLKKHDISLEEIIQDTTIINYQLDLDTLVIKAKKTGLLKNSLSINQRYQIAQSYISNHTINPSDFLKNISVLFSYKSTHFASGHLATYNTPPYDDMMEKFMATAIADIPNFYAETYLYKNSYGKPNYALFLGNKEEGFVIKTTDTTKIDFNHEAVYHLFNTVLKHKNIDKRFTFKENQSKYRYEVIYAKPNALETFLKSIGKTIEDIKYE